MVRGLVAAGVAVALVAALAIGSVVSAARTDDHAHTDAIVVLGASQYWGTPSPVFANRLDHARELFKEGVAPMIVTVGGGIPGDKTTEAEAGADYLVRSGVPGAAVTAVAVGSDTITSLEAVAQRATKKGWTTVTLVSDRAHLGRSRAIAEAVGFDEARVSGPASGDGSNLGFDYVLREAGGQLRFYAWDRWMIDSPRQAPASK
ncbi:MAG: YdcF family protein [Candidatus Nanopelagicales bacterium]|nr:YdcF family protein [Candidatus Nanopelagicales bacterium]MDZ4250692.1 YdcF family protein [Candidatus Nanopelagicales bacterium]